VFYDGVEGGGEEGGEEGEEEEGGDEDKVGRNVDAGKKKPAGAVRVFGQDFALEDAIGSHACSLEALACV
jgi:hypothetical protein